MKLCDYIEIKKEELTTVNGFRSAELNNLGRCKISKNIKSCVFAIGQPEKFDMDIEIEEVEKSNLTDEQIDVIEVAFNVVKPRCRKPIRHSVYVR